MAIIAFSLGFEFIALYLTFSTLPVIIFLQKLELLSFIRPVCNIPALCVIVYRIEIIALVTRVTTR